MMNKDRMSFCENKKIIYIQHIQHIQTWSKLYVLVMMTYTRNYYVFRERFRHELVSILPWMM
jgi:hypothetical protein